MNKLSTETQRPREHNLSGIDEFLFICFTQFEIIRVTYTGIFVPLLHTDQFSIHRVPPINTVAVVHCIDTVITIDRKYHGEISADIAKETGTTTEK